MAEKEHPGRGRKRKKTEEENDAGREDRHAKGTDGEAEDRKSFTIQTSWDTFCTEVALKNAVGVAVPLFTRATCEAWQLLGLYLTRLADNGEKLDMFEDQMTYYRAIACTFRDHKACADPCMQATSDIL